MCSGKNLVFAEGYFIWSMSKLYTEKSGFVKHCAAASLEQDFLMKEIFILSGIFLVKSKVTKKNYILLILFFLKLFQTSVGDLNDNVCLYCDSITSDR